MLRENYNNDGIIKEYKNGNITIKYYSEGMQESKRDSLLTLSSLLDMIDCYFIGETYCLSNYETGHTIYNCNRNERKQDSNQLHNRRCKD